jgi:Holliday junction DNA helicase RuvA
MIGKLTGNVDSLYEDNLILNVNDVGYIVFCSSSTLSQVSLNERITLYIHMLVREDQMSLYGFLEESEKSWFLVLQQVQGVGAKMALSILSAYPPETIVNSILAEDISAFKAISGIGPKLASRIVNELKSKKEITSFNWNSPKPTKAKNDRVETNNSSIIISDAMSALSNLGFARKDMFPIINQLIADNENITLENLITSTLSKLSNN